MSVPGADDLKSWDRAHVWHAFTQMAEYEPLILERAQGCLLWDIDGREYIDGVSSLWCNIHGHRHPKIDAAVRRQLDRVAHVTSLGGSNPTTIQLAKRLVDLALPGLKHVFFSDDGATAVEAAIKMALQYWRQRKDPKPDKTCYLALGEAYHGDTLGAVSVGGVERFHAMFRPLLFDTIRLPAPDTYRTPGDCRGDCPNFRGDCPNFLAEKMGLSPSNSPCATGLVNAIHQYATGSASATEMKMGLSPSDFDELCNYHLAKLEQALSEHHRRIAAMVIEPLVQAAAGMIMHPAGYLSGVRALTRKYDVLLIADEVAVGFGRTGKMFACEHESVTPDLLCLAKGITGGYLPLAATLATEEIYRAFLGDYSQSKTFFHGHTYGGNPLGAAAALACLDIFDEEKTLECLRPKIARLSEHLARVGCLPHVGHVRQCGLIGAIELVRDKATKEPYPWAEKRGMKVCDYARSEGVLLRPLGNVIVIMPPLSITLEQLDKILAAVERGIGEAVVE